MYGSLSQNETLESCHPPLVSHAYFFSTPHMINRDDIALDGVTLAAL